MTTDLTQPVIIATLPAPGGPPCPLLIDGTHRPYKAAAQGRAHLPSWVLTEAETLVIRRPARPGLAPEAPRRAPGRGSRR